LSGGVAVCSEEVAGKTTVTREIITIIINVKSLSLRSFSNITDLKEEPMRIWQIKTA
jgi:hypothetical protein